MFVSLVTVVATAQNAELRGMFTQGLDDLGAIKIKAERGDAVAQVKLANAYLSQNQPANAAVWYEAAAKQNSTEGEYELGNLLLYGRLGIPRDQSVIAKPTEGLKWTYLASTNGCQEAWYNMARANQNGIGCATNPVEAYAWFALLADKGDVVGRVQMNNLALKFSSEEIIRGKSLEAEMEKGHWPQLELAQSVAHSVPLILRGISGPENNRLAIINDVTLAENDTTAFKANGQIVKVTCLKISDDGVLIKVEGEDKPRFLRLQ